MATNERTSARIAEIAGRGLKDPGSLTYAEIREVCGSVLTQVPDHTANVLTPFRSHNYLAGRTADGRLIDPYKGTILED
jgi:hypothetical protein